MVCERSPDVYLIKPLGFINKNDNLIPRMERGLKQLDDMSEGY